MSKQDVTGERNGIDRLVEIHADEIAIVDEAHRVDRYEAELDWEFLGDDISPEAGPKTPFWIPPAIRWQHLYLLGRTGTGKSTFLNHLGLSDVARGDGLMVLDPHGDLVEDIVEFCPDKQRDRLIYWDPADREWPVPLNLFECRPGQNKDTVCSEVIGIFKRLYGDSWGPALEDLLRNLALAMLDHQLLNDSDVPKPHRFNATLKEAHDFLFNQALRKAYYPFLTNRMVRSFWEDQYDNLGQLRGGATVTKEQIRHAASTTNKLRRLLLNELLFDITTNNDCLSTIDLRSAMDDQRVLLVNLSKGKLGEDNSSLIGSVLLSRLLVAALSRADLSQEQRRAKPFHVIADEFQSFATSSFKLLLSEARKYGLTLTIAHQHRDQLDLEMKGAALNCGSMVAFRVIGRDAPDVAREFDSSPGQVGWGFEPRMAHRRDEMITDEWVVAKLAETDPNLSAAIVRNAQIDDELKELDAKLLAAQEADFKWKSHVSSCTASEHSACQPSRWLSFDESQAEVAALRSTYVPAIAALNDEQRQMRDVIADTLDQSGWSRSYWVRSEKDDRGLYERVARKDTYAETERRIANELTQLPNFHAKVRLADCSEALIRVLPPPTTTGHRDEAVELQRERTRKAQAIAPLARRSVREAEYLRELNRQQAHLYQAELEDQP